MLTLPMLNLHLITAYSHNLRLGEPFVFLSILLSVFARLYWLYWSVESHCDYVFQWPVYQHFSKLVGAMWTEMLAKLKEYFLGWLHNCVISSAINWLIRSKLLLWGCNIWNFMQKYFFFFEKIGPVSPKYV